MTTIPVKKEFLEVRHISVKTKLLVGDSCGAKLKVKTKTSQGIS